MDHERRFERDQASDPPSEGVRIIGAEEAAEAVERGDVARRRPDHEPRFGDRPSPPPADGPRPVLRFPLGSSAPAPEPISEPVELPHWTQPPTGQVPQILPDQPRSSHDEPDDWAGFATSTPRWRDDSDQGFDEVRDDSWMDEERLGALDDSERPTHDDFFTFADIDDQPRRSVFADVDEDLQPDLPPPPAGEGWDEAPGFLDDPDPYDDPPTRRVATGQRVGRAAAAAAGTRIPRPGAPGGSGGDRDLAQAAIVGAGLLALVLVLFKVGPAAVLLLVLLVIGAATAELYAVLRQAGYQPIVLAGVASSVGLVIGAYNYGPAAFPTVLFLTTAVCLLWYLAGAATESPVLNIGVTLLGVLWVGTGGAFAAMMIAPGSLLGALAPVAQAGEHPGLGLFFAAVIGTVGYDVGGLFIGKNAGRQPLSAASPNKTWEGLIGGCVVAVLLVVLLAAVVGLGTIDSPVEGFLVGLTVALAAPLGDLCQSLVKRDLGVKDMGSILPGHGGLLDRFDGLLFVLPAVYLIAQYRDFFVK